MLPIRGVILVITDERGNEVVFGFFKFPMEIEDVNGQAVAEIPIDWVFDDFLCSSDPRYRAIVHLFSAAGFLQGEQDDFA